MLPALKISGLTKTYKGGFQALKGIDLTVKQGDFFALLGPNGAGKSTTIGIITSLVNKTAGSVAVFGHDIDQELEAAKSFIGLVPQEFNFNQFELRLMIARALMHEPKMLILDEPTAGVDIELRRSMWGFLRELNEQGITIILTTHYLEEAEMLCRNIAIIDSGIIVENTDMKSLLAKLDVETFVFDLKPNSAPVALDNLSSRVIDDHTLEVDVNKSQTINAIFVELNKQGLEVLSMRNKSNRLEELFVSLVGSGQASVDSAVKE